MTDPFAPRHPPALCICCGTTPPTPHRTMCAACIAFMCLPTVICRVPLGEELPEPLKPLGFRVVHSRGANWVLYRVRDYPDAATALAAAIETCEAWAKDWPDAMVETITDPDLMPAGILP